MGPTAAAGADVPDKGGSVVVRHNRMCWLGLYAESQLTVVNMELNMCHLGIFVVRKLFLIFFSIESFLFNELVVSGTLF